MKTVGAPVKLLHESVVSNPTVFPLFLIFWLVFFQHFDFTSYFLVQGFTCTVELKSGEVYRGLVVDVEDNWNIQLQAVAYTSREGMKSQLDHVYLRGSQVRFIILPDMLRNSPIFTRFTPQDRARNPIVNTEAPKVFKKPRIQ